MRRGRERPGIVTRRTSDAIAWCGENSLCRWHASCGRQKAAERVGAPRHAGERVGVGRGRVRRLPGRDSVTDPRGPGSGSYRMYRGGGWLLPRRRLPVVDIATGATLGDLPTSILGFRLLRTVPVALWRYYPFALCAYGAIDGGREDGKAGADAPEPSGEPAARSAVRHGAKRRR